MWKIQNYSSEISADSFKNGPQINNLPTAFEMKLKFLAILSFTFLLFEQCLAQSYTFEDSLRGAFHQNRSNNDLLHYHLKINVNPVTRYISGFNKLTCKGLSEAKSLQIDLVEAFDIERIASSMGDAKWKRIGSSVLVSLPVLFKKDEIFWVQVFYKGHPHPASNAPWEGGFVWQKDKEGLPWIGVACEGEGSSFWFPSKDHPSDEPDSVFLQFEVPRNLTVVSNGQFVKKESVTDSSSLFSFKVHYPINHYNITFNAAFYKTWSDTLQLPESKKILKLSYFALPEDLENAKRQFGQSKQVIKELSKLFGDYPFVRDGYKLVQTPYLGMEHQSCIAYGNNFKNNAFGFDFIVMHETGHEWWGNQISANDHADMWIHESFCTYSEALFVEKLQGKAQAINYLLEQKKKIKNRSPLLGPRDVYFNSWKDSDMYYKGTWMLHSLRQVVDNDSLWFAWLHGFSTKFGLVPISTEAIVAFASSYFGIELKPFFNQYLRQTELPQLQVKQTKEGEVNTLLYRWKCKEIDFQYPVEILVNSQVVKIKPNTSWQSMELPNGNATIDPLESGVLLDFKVLN